MFGFGLSGVGSTCLIFSDLLAAGQSDIGYGIALDGGGDAVIGGYANNGTDHDCAVLKLDSNYTLDSGFGGGDGINKGYMFGSIQTARGCPMDYEFCSVTSFQYYELLLYRFNHA